VRQIFDLAVPLRHSSECKTTTSWRSSLRSRGILKRYGTVEIRRGSAAQDAWRASRVRPVMAFDVHEESQMRRRQESVFRKL
jgi:hypothetical protein